MAANPLHKDFMLRAEFDLIFQYFKTTVSGMSVVLELAQEENNVLC